MSPSPENNSKPTGNLIHLPNTYWLMWLENVQKGPKNDQNQPKNVENQANWPKNIQKFCNKLLQNSYLGQKTRDFNLNSYCWSPNLMGSSFLASHTICTSVENIWKCLQVLANYPSACKWMQNFWLKVLTRVSKGLQVITGACKCKWLQVSFCKYLQVFANVWKCLQLFASGWKWLLLLES